MEQIKEVPAELNGIITLKHYQDLHLMSGLSAQTILENGLYSLNENEVKQALGLKMFVGPGLKFTYLEAIDKVMKDAVNIRLDVPIVDKEGKSRRYMRKKGVRVVPYIPKRTFEVLDKPEVPLFFVEGEKKALCLTQFSKFAIAFSGVWNFLSQKKPLQELKSMKLKGRKVFICYDGDKILNPQVMLAQDRLAKTLSKLGADVWIINLPPGEKPDEFIVKNGINAFDDIIKEAQKYGYIDLPRIILPKNDIVYFTEKALELIQNQNATAPFLFLQGNQPVRVEKDSDGKLFVVGVDEYIFRYHICRLAEWLTYNSQVIPVLTVPSLSYIRDALASPELGFPILKGITQSPVFTKEGVFEQRFGYSWDSGLFHCYPASLKIPPVSKRPTQEEVLKAKSLILNDLLVDFPFISDSDRAHAFLLAVLPFMRELIQGPCPLFLIEKATPGTGASLLVQCIAMICSGHDYRSLSESHNEEEFRKRVTSVLRHYPQMVVIDNLSTELKSGILASMLTSHHWEDRLLGKTEHLFIPIRAIFVATANNPFLSDEMVRRTIRSRMDAGMENPHLRDPRTFKHSEILNWVKNNRAELIWAACTLIQYWISKGMPKSKKFLGMFEDWAFKSGGLLELVGVNGFMENLKEFYSDVNDEKENFKAFIYHWYDNFGSEETVTGSLFELVQRSEAINVDLGTTSNERSQRTRFGYFLKSLRGRTFEIQHRNMKLALKVCKASRTINHTTAYFLEVCDRSVITQGGQSGSAKKVVKVKCKREVGK